MTLVHTKNLTEVGEDVGLQEGLKMISAFREANPDATTGYFIGRKIIDQILSQPGCVGINFRKCLSGANEHLVYTGVDADGKDILQYTVVTNNGSLKSETAIVADHTWWDLDNVDTLLGND